MFELTDEDYWIQEMEAEAELEQRIQDELELEKNALQNHKG